MTTPNMGEILVQQAQEAERLLFTTFGENCKYLYDVIYYILNRNK